MKFNPRAALVLAVVMSAFSAFWAPPAAAQARFTYSSDGSEVNDSATGLVWRRCAEGMVWSGATCTGSARAFTHEQALLHAQSQTGWRMPNVKELTSIVDRSRVNPSINVEAFPATPATVFWSSSPYAGNFPVAWGVGFNNGGVGNDYRSYNYQVRLVRASQ